MRTHTKFISFARLAATNNGVVPVVTVALVCNDLAIANSSMGGYEVMKTSGPLGHVRRGGRMYFARVQCGHLSEGMKAIREIQNDPRLHALIQRCGQVAQDAFAELCECLPGGTEHSKFDKYVKWIRNRIAFHYGAKDLLWAINDRSQRDGAKPSTLTAGEDIHSTRFEFGDDVLDSIVCRNLWKIPRSANLQDEADKNAEWCSIKCREFLRFGGDFVPRFLKERRVVI